jgi:hypothetical protein
MNKELMKELKLHYIAGTFISKQIRIRENDGE